ncbi:aldo/keto reductase [Flavobacterium akiainvivens]|uniref:Aldo/keto reductase n=1 Tax=Flavobacterium akiainvivens TaxID=1202724 RepID=A0A0M8MGI3_9FLAO|nr:aldo/keto reductase [Flavobacterium akiainvivens]KOS05771.1 aldo/keto reductase [Flavobacterium akiainvivens]SFQ77442.1 Predicted oxidoreductase [Flavobacterium akiainvivens]
MQTRQLGKNGPVVSAIGIGLNRESGKSSSERESISNQTKETLDHAIESGLNYIDTGDFYGMGLQEMNIGQTIKGRRDKVFLSVKTGTLRAPNGHILGLDCRPQAIKNFCSHSLTRLGVDEIDLYQPARIDPNVPIEETVGAIKDLINEGKVKYLGLSEANAEQLRRAHAIHTVTALEIEYSLATRFIENEILPTARKLGVGIVPYSINYYGLLTGNVKPPFPQGDFKNMLPRFQGENFESNRKLVEWLELFAAQKGKSASQIALAWLLSKGNDIVPVVGMNRPERVSQNIEAMNIVFTSEELAELEAVFSHDAIKGTRYPEALLGWVAS